MKFAVYIALASICFFFFSCKKEKCKNPMYVPRAKIVTECFGNYKPDAYWIYLNKDSTKRDSMWVDNYRTYKVSSKQDACAYADDIINFDLHYLYLDNIGKLKFELRYAEPTLKTNLLKADNSYSVESYLKLFARDDSASFYRNTGQPGYPIINGYEVIVNDTNYILDKVFHITDKVIVAPHYGIIRYNKNNDTFSLVKFYTP